MVWAKTLVSEYSKNRREKKEKKRKLQIDELDQTISKAHIHHQKKKNHCFSRDQPIKILKKQKERFRKCKRDQVDELAN